MRDGGGDCSAGDGWEGGTRTIQFTKIVVPNIYYLLIDIFNPAQYP